MKRVVLPLVLVVAALNGTAAASVPNVKAMVLRLSDMPAGFAQDYSHAVSRDQVVKEQGFVMPGYVTGWETQFTRGEGFRTAQLVSTVSQYRSSAQAHASMLDSFKRAAKEKKVKRISVGAALGDESRAFTFDHTQDGVTVTVYIVLWRSGNLKARIFLGGLASIGATAEQATRLAVKQQARMKAAR